MWLKKEYPSQAIISWYCVCHKRTHLKNCDIYIYLVYSIFSAFMYFVFIFWSLPSKNLLLYFFTSQNHFLNNESKCRILYSNLLRSIKQLFLGFGSFAVLETWHMLFWEEILCANVFQNALFVYWRTSSLHILHSVEGMTLVQCWSSEIKYGGYRK